MGLELSLAESPDTLMGSPCTVLYIHGGAETLTLLVYLPGEGKGVLERSSDGSVERWANSKHHFNSVNSQVQGNPLE